MKTQHLLHLVLSPVLLFGLVACGAGGGESDNDDDDYSGSGTLIIRPAKNFPLPSTYTSNDADAEGRRLLAQCAQCHGTNGYSVGGIESLVDELYELGSEMAEQRNKGNYHIMNAQAKGYTAEEVESIRRYLAGLVNSLGAGSNGSEGGYDDD